MLSFPPDWTFLAQIGLFLLVWQCLRRLVFEPNLEVLHTRQQRTEGVQQDAAAIKADTQAMQDQYQRRLATIRTEARQRVDAAYQSAESQARDVVDAARREAERSLAGVRETLEQEIRQTRHNLEARLPELVRDIGEKLLERRVS